MARWILVIFFLVCGGVACEAADGSSELAGGTSGGGDNGGGSGGTNFTAGVGGDTGLGPALAWISGTVLAPEGTIGINEALVYVTNAPLDAIPQQVYCDKCVNLDGQVPYTLAGVDGTFSLGVPQLGEWTLVVQKGSFRRARTITVTDGSSESAPQQIAAADTTLPSARDAAAGDEIPKMAVVNAAHDSIENTLAKLGLGQVDSSGTLMSGTESFDVYETPFLGPEPGSASDLLTDYSLLSQYHIVFFGCDSSWFNDLVFSDATVKNNLRNFVESGGKLYVTDWSYDVLRYTFDMESPLSWEGDDGSPDSAHTGVYDAPATVNDDGMRDWLAAQNIVDFTLEANWTIVSSANSYTAPDEDGAQQQFDPTVWVSGQTPSGIKPSTMTYQYGCGRALFSTYHTEAGFGTTLAAQERALLYIILEVNVCIGDLKPPE